MKDYMKLSRIKFAPNSFSKEIKIELGTKNSETTYIEDGKTTKLWVITKSNPNQLVSLGAEIAQTLKCNDGYNLVIDSNINQEFLLENILLALTDTNVYKANYVSPCTYIIHAPNLESVYMLAYPKAEAYHLTRMINHLPFSVCNSDTLSNEIEDLLDDPRFKIEIYRHQECVQLGLHGVLALSTGAKYQPAVIKIEYNNADTPKIGLVGKGIMFDSGGYNIKSGDFASMKTDMAGAGAVIGTLKALANLNIETNVVGYLMTTDNLINENALVPGEVINYRNGVSVEIGNIDAEGRLVLADGLLLASQENCNIVIDIATLTGNSAAALGKGFAPLYSTDSSVTELFTNLNYTSTDNIWPMPLPDEYNTLIEGNISDLRNISSTKHAGSVMAALFLKHFAPKNSKWVHIDMGAMSRKEEFGTPVNGFGVRLLTNFIINYKI